MDEEVSVRIGADTSGVDAGAKDVVKDVGTIDASVAELKKSIDALSSSITKTFSTIPKSPVEDEAKKGKKALDDEAASVANLTKKIEAETAAFGMDRVAREATLRTMQQQEALGRAGIKVTADQASSLMRLNTEWAKARGGGGKEAGGLFGLQKNELQNLSYQLNDVFTQLASGTSVTQVFAQQGPQIAQVFGANILGSILPLLPVIALVGVGLAGIGLGLAKVSSDAETLRTFTAQLALNADGARYQASVLAQNATALDHYGATLKEARSEVTLFTSKGVDPTRVVAFGQAAQNLADIMKIDVVTAADRVVTAFTGGYDAVVKLDEAVNFLTETQREEIREAFASGDAKRAQEMAFKAFQGRAQDGADHARTDWTDANRTFAASWDGLMEALSKSDGIQSTKGEILGLIGAVSSAVDWFNKLGAAKQSATGDIPGSKPKYRYDPGEAFGQEWGYIGFGPMVAPTPKVSSAGLNDYLKPKDMPADPQAKAKNDIVAALQAQRNETLKINDAERIRLAGAQAVLKAETDQKINRKDLLAEIKKEAEETKRAEIAKENASSARSGASAAQAAANRASRAAREALQDQIAAIDTQKEAANLAYADQMALEDQKLAKLKDFYGQDSREYQAALREKGRMEQAEIAKQDGYIRQRIQTTRQVAALQADVDIATQRAALDTKKADLDAMQAAGLIGTTDYYARLAELDRAETAVTAQEINNRYQIQLIALDSLIDLAIEGTEEHRRLEEEKTRITAEQAAARAKAEIAATASAAAVVRSGFDATRQKAQGIVQPIAGAFTGLFTGLATGTQSFSQGWANVGQAILGVINQAVTQMVTNWVLGQLGMTTATAAGAGTRVGIEAGAATATTAISGTSALVQIGHKAAVAAAGAYSAIASIPIVGPVLAPIAAAAALAGVLALGKSIFSAEGGWGEVPADGMTTTLHRKEMVLPASIATPLRAALATDGTSALSSGRRESGGDSFSLAISAIDGRSVRRLFEDHQDVLADLIRKAIREGKVK